MTTNKQIHADKLIEFIDNHTDWHTRIKNDLKGFINSVSSTPLESESLKESAINQISHYQVKVDELNKQLSEFTNQILEQNKEIGELKELLSKAVRTSFMKDDEIKRLKSQSGSKSGYEELLEWIDERFKGEIHDAETTRMILCFKDKILSLSSNKESKGREIEFAEWVDGNYNKESDDEYILKEDLRIIYKEEDEEVYTIKQLYLKFQSLPPSTSKVEAKPEAGIEAENIGSNYQTAKPSLQEGEKKTAEEYLENKENIFPSIQYNFKGKDIAEMMEEYNQFRSTDSKKAVEAKPMSIEECKDVVAKSYKQDNWKTFQKFCQDFGYVKMLDEAINEAITLYANQSK